MRFRFTLTHRGSESSPFALPSLDQWETQTGAGTEWSLGSIPNVTLPGVTFGGDSSEYLYADYSFEAGREYSVTVSYTKTFLSGVSNPRTITLYILDGSFATLFSQIESTPISPGGTGSVTIDFTATADCDKVAIKVTDGSEVTFTINSASGTSVDPSDTTTSLEINEPDGWKDAVLKLGRDKDFRSLVEFFEGSFIFYGNNGVVNGGIDFIKALELQYGPDVSIEMLIELTTDDYTFETVFDGQLDLSLAEELIDNKFRIPIIRDNFWAKFMNRRDTPVDLFASTDLDLGAIAEPNESVQLILSSQIITYYTEAHANYPITYPADSPDGNAMLINFDNIIQDDVKLFTITRASAETEVAKVLGLFEAPYNGEYIIEIKLPVGLYNEASFPGLWSTDSTVRLRLNKTNSEAVDIYQYFDGDGTILSSGSDDIALFHLTLTYNMVRGEQLAIRLHRADTGDPVTVFGELRLIWKTNCELATSQQITLSGEQSIDGVMTSSDRVLVKNQGNPEENGIYVSGAGAWTRATDLDIGDEAYLAAVYIVAGDNQSDSSWYQSEVVGTIGVDPQIWTITDNSDERSRELPLAIFEDENFGNYIKITAKTKFRETEQSSLLIHDAGAAILKSYGLGEDNPFYSEVMGSSLTNARQYDTDGCIWNHVVLRGLQLRGYTLAEKPFFLSFNEWWKGVNPIFNLGLTYELIEGYTIDPEESAIQDLPDWDDAGGSFPGAWNYAVFSYPFTSVNGDGGTEGYTCGTMATTAGETYVLTTVVEIFETGSNPTNITLIFAILDASFEEIVTEEFIYTSDGFKVETFTLTPPTDGTYFALRVVNDTVSDTKSLVFRLAKGDTVSQLLSNEDFDTAFSWTSDGAGTAWVVAGDGEAVITLASGSSQELNQEFDDGAIGEYHFISEYTSAGVSGDTVELTVNFYDSGNNLVDTKTDTILVNSTKPFNHIFDSLVVVTQIQIIAEITAGSDIEITIPYAGLFITVPTEAIVVPDETVIRVEEVEHFYDPEFVFEISNIRDITRKYDNDHIFNKINIGYTTWKSEEISGIDDTQTQHIYSTRFEKVGETITLWSDFIAASLAIEGTRRRTISESTDYKFDDSTFIIAVNPDDVSPDVFRPELDENFSSIENLLDPELRYNTRLSVARNFQRWRKWFNGCLQNFLNSYYKFVRGEGNFDMISTLVEQSPDCLNEDYDGNPLSEKQDIEVTDEFIHLPNYYEFETYLQWEDYKIIRDNRKKAIGISLTDENHVALFIDQLEYSIMHGKAKISGWTNEFMELAVVEDAAAQQICDQNEGIDDSDDDGIFDYTFDDTFE